MKKEVDYMKILGAIMGFILALPILITLVVLVCVTLVGGYVALIFHIGWWLVLAVLAIVITVKLIKKFL